MTYPLPLKIVGLGHHVPPRVVESGELERAHGIDSGWIARIQGVLERRWVTDESNSEMGAAAARESLREAGHSRSPIHVGETSALQALNSFP